MSFFPPKAPLRLTYLLLYFFLMLSYDTLLQSYHFPKGYSVCRVKFSASCSFPGFAAVLTLHMWSVHIKFYILWNETSFCLQKFSVHFQIRSSIFVNMENNFTFYNFTTLLLWFWKLNRLVKTLDQKNENHEVTRKLQPLLSSVRESKGRQWNLKFQFHKCIVLITRSQREIANS